MAYMMWRQFLETLHVEDDRITSASTEQQRDVEDEVSRRFRSMRDIRSDLVSSIHLLKEKHYGYLKFGIYNLSSNFECLDASRPWLCYWILHSIYLLGHSVGDDLGTQIIEFLKRCQNPEGGFGGGPGQISHLAPTYASVLALCIIGKIEAYEAIDRPALQLFINRMHNSDGSFIMHDGGETDIRGVYCALVSALLTNTRTPGMFEHTGEWLTRCQTYEGGFSAVPGSEAHGGYSFCGFASSLLLDNEQKCDTQKLLRWACNRQMKLEGGFQGRTNKLVDGCYSFWVGGLFPLVHLALLKQGANVHHNQLLLFHQESLQEYVLYCCQSVNGGLVDKPGRTRDFYHTCYGLSGLSVSQHCLDGKIVNITEDKSDILGLTHPVFNIVTSKVECALAHFKSLPIPI